MDWNHISSGFPAPISWTQHTIIDRDISTALKALFPLAALGALGAPQRFINWISQCLSTASFTIAINGNSSGFFKSTKGLRQGDPLSPYLFVLAMEVFTRLLTSRFESGYINYHPGTAELNISHLMFADDVMIFLTELAHPFMVLTKPWMTSRAGQVYT